MVLCFGFLPPAESLLLTARYSALSGCSTASRSSAPNTSRRTSVDGAPMASSHRWNLRDEGVARAALRDRRRRPVRRRRRRRRNLHLRLRAKILKSSVVESSRASVERGFGAIERVRRTVHARARVRARARRGDRRARRDVVRSVYFESALLTAGREIQRERAPGRARN